MTLAARSFQRRRPAAEPRRRRPPALRRRLHAVRAACGSVPHARRGWPGILHLQCRAATATVLTLLAWDSCCFVSRVWSTQGREAGSQQKSGNLHLPGAPRDALRVPLRPRHRAHAPQAPAAWRSRRRAACCRGADGSRSRSGPKGRLAQTTECSRLTVRWIQHSTGDPAAGLCAAERRSACNASASIRRPQRAVHIGLPRHRSPPRSWTSRIVLLLRSSIPCVPVLRRKGCVGVGRVLSRSQTSRRSGLSKGDASNFSRPAAEIERPATCVGLGPVREP